MNLKTARTVRSVLLGLALLAMATACLAKKPDYDDPASALDAAAKARSEKNYETAITAYQYVIEKGTGKATCEGLLGLGETLAAKRDVEEARTAFLRAEKECQDFDSHAAMREIDAWIQGPESVELAKKSLDRAQARFPGEKEKFEKQRQAIDALESGDTQKLKSLGYVGD